MQATNSTVYPDEDRQRYMFRKAIETIKDAVSIPDYLRTHGVEVKRNRARCIVHGGDNPESFSIDPERGLWHCFRCNEGGDVIELCELVERHLESWTATVSLAEQFGIDLPRRPERWHTWQNEKHRRRKMIRDALAAGYQRRYLRVYGGYLEHIEDPAEREAEARLLWNSLRPAAQAAAENRMVGR